MYFLLCGIFVATWAFSLVSVSEDSSHSTWAQELQLPGSRAQAQWLWLTSTCCPTARGIFLDQGSSPCLLHLQADSLWLRKPVHPPFFTS